MHNLRSILVLLILVVMFTACGGGGGDSDTPATTPASLTGQFIDDPVKGLGYTCSSGKTGTTNSNGEYICNIGDNVTFFIGSIKIGSAKADTIAITPYSLFPNDYDAALNLARLLQSINTKQANGIIVVDSSLEDKIPKDINFSNLSFETEIEAYLGIDLVTPFQAQTTMNSAIIEAGVSIPSNLNYIPFAYIGANQNVKTSYSVTLNAASSSDGNGDPLTYNWEVISKPINSNVSLSNTTSINPTFIPDIDGTYIFQLVVNDGNVDSSPDIITIVSETNYKPVANAGINQSVSTNTELAVTLDASLSSDVNSDTLTYLWKIISKPTGSNSILSNATIIKPTFIADTDGNYIFELIVNDGNEDSLPVNVTVNAVNDAPISNAGADQNVKTTLSVNLNGSSSSDKNLNSLSYKWVIISKPANSNAVLSTDIIVNPTFVADIDGSYIVQLIVNDGQVDSLADSVTIVAANSIPIANAGIDQTVDTASLVSLDASVSLDSDLDPISYFWSIKSKPVSSSAVLSDTMVIRPTFIADIDGTYVLQLVVNDGVVNSPADLVTINAINTIPIANAGNDKNVYAGAVVTLDGSLSSDTNLNPLTYSWLISSTPVDSNAVLSNAASIKPIFVPDKDGKYVIQLVVNDGVEDSIIDYVTINAKTINYAPQANAGNDKTVLFNSEVVLDGSLSSDANLDFLTYSWFFVSKPSDSNAQLLNSTTLNPSFYTDKEGDYVIKLIVNDGIINSEEDTITINAGNYMEHNGFVYGTFISPYTGKRWLDRNLGATQVCVDLNETACFGDYYQWGRNTDGHEKSTSSTAYVALEAEANITNVGHGNYIGSLATTNNFDWAYYLSDNDSTGLQRSVNWSKTDGSSVCPVGYRVPNVYELVLEKLDSIDMVNGNYGDFLKLPYAGYRNNEGVNSSDFLEVSSISSPNFKGNALAIRCISDENINANMPIANAGITQDIKTGSLVSLSASLSSSPIHKSLTYSWKFIVKPEESTATLSSSTSINPTFTADKAGLYELGLVVNDGTLNSLESKVKINAIDNIGSTTIKNQVIILNDQERELIMDNIHKESSFFYYKARDILSDYWMQIYLPREMLENDKNKLYYVLAGDLSYNRALNIPQYVLYSHMDNGDVSYSTYSYKIIKTNRTTGQEEHVADLPLSMFGLTDTEYNTLLSQYNSDNGVELTKKEALVRFSKKIPIAFQQSSHNTVKIDNFIYIPMQTRTASFYASPYGDYLRAGDDIDDFDEQHLLVLDIANNTMKEVDITFRDEGKYNINERQVLPLMNLNNTLLGYLPPKMDEARVTKYWYNDNIVLGSYDVNPITGDLVETSSTEVIENAGGFYTYFNIYIKDDNHNGIYELYTSVVKDTSYTDFDYFKRDIYFKIEDGSFKKVNMPRTMFGENFGWDEAKNEVYYGGIVNFYINNTIYTDGNPFIARVKVNESDFNLEADIKYFPTYLTHQPCWNVYDPISNSFKLTLGYVPTAVVNLDFDTLVPEQPLVIDDSSTAGSCSQNYPNELSNEPQFIGFCQSAHYYDCLRTAYPNKSTELTGYINEVCSTLELVNLNDACSACP